MLNSEIKKANQELSNLLITYADIPVSILYERYNINPRAKRCKQSLSIALIKNSNNKNLISFVENENVMVKTVQLVRDGNVEASLSLPSFRFDEIVKEQWDESSLRKLLYRTIFVLIFFEEETYAKRKNTYIKKGLIWQMPKEIIDSEVRKSWDYVVECLKAGKIVKYIGEDGRFHTYFPRTSDGLYVHVRPHAATSNSNLPLPVPDILTGLTEYQMHSFWLNRMYIQKLLYQGDEQ